jgi:type IV conjugative transfer system protein TraL
MRKCSKSIDKPFLFLGLEIEEIGVLILVFYLIMAFSYLFAAGLASGIAWVVMLKIKKNKPQGSLLHYFYKLGMPLDGLINNAKKGKKFSLFSKY